MKEGTPITPLAEEEIADRPQRLAYALSQVKVAEEVVMNSPNHEYIIDECRDGQKNRMVTDPVVIQAMKGGTSRIYQDVVDHYGKPLAESVRRAYVPQNYQSALPYKPKR